MRLIDGNALKKLYEDYEGMSVPIDVIMANIDDMPTIELRENCDLKLAMYKNGIKQKDLAKQLGITQEYFSKMLSKELTRDQKEAIEFAIVGNYKKWDSLHKKRITHNVKCFKCGCVFMLDRSEPEPNFCPNCGSKMKEENKN